MTIAKTTNICPTRSFVGVKRFSRRGTGSPRRLKFSRSEKITYDGNAARRPMSAQSAHSAYQFKIGSAAFWSEQTTEFNQTRLQFTPLPLGEASCGDREFTYATFSGT